MNTVHGFNNSRDIDRIMRMLDKFEAQQGQSKQGTNRFSQQARYAKILTVLDPGPTEAKDKEGTGVEVVWDADSFDFVVVPSIENPVSYDATALDGAGATVFMTSNISSPSAMAVDDIVLLQHYPHLSETSDWLVVETGGGGSRSYVIITAVTSPSLYTGNVITSPDDSTVIDTGVTIKVSGALGNEFEVGYSAFADKVDDVYYLDGFLLG